MCQTNASHVRAPDTLSSWTMASDSQTRAEWALCAALAITAPDICKHCLLWKLYQLAGERWCHVTGSKYADSVLFPTREMAVGIYMAGSGITLLTKEVQS